MAHRSSSEEWRPAPGFEYRYVVSDHGRIRNSSTGRMLSGEIDRDGYRLVNLVATDGKSVKRRVHRLVCQAFHGPPPENHEVGHDDGTPLNNRASNLAWVTRRENNLQMVAHGRAGPGPKTMHGEDHVRARLTDRDVREIREKVASGTPRNEIASRFGIFLGHVDKIVRRERWAHVD